MDDIDAGRARRPIVNAGQVALKCTLRDEYENSVDWDYRVCGISYPYLGSGSGHGVTAIVRHREKLQKRDQVSAAAGNVHDAIRLTELLQGHEAVIGAFNPG